MPAKATYGGSSISQKDWNAALELAERWKNYGDPGKSLSLLAKAFLHLKVCYDEQKKLCAGPEQSAWTPTPEFPLFDEKALQNEIVRVWGKHGAHADVYLMLMADSARYRWLREERDEQQPVVTQATFSTWGNPWRDVPLWGDDLDLAVDSAMLSSATEESAKNVG